MRFKLFFGLLFFVGCKSTIYLTPEQKQILGSHRTVSILPVAVIFDERDTSSDQTVDFVKKEGYFFQNQLQNLLDREMNRYSVIFQDISKTNILLDNESVNYDVLFKKDKVELGKILGTDAILIVAIHRGKPELTYVPPNYGYMSGYYAYRTTIDIDAALYNSADGKLLWEKKRYTIGDSYSFSGEQLSIDLISEICNDLPYKQK